MVCQELFKAGTAKKTVEFWKYDVLDQNRRRLIKGWWKLANELNNKPKQNKFQSFVFAWLAFNSWGMCITEAKDDAIMIKSLGLSNDLNQKFEEIKAKENSKLALTTNQFIKFLPVFDVTELREKNLERWDKQSRRERVLFYFNNGATIFDPQCWQRHINEETNGQPLPSDWAHIIKAIYKIRCNLFHGSKSPFVEGDKNLVSLAYSILSQFIEEANYLR